MPQSGAGRPESDHLNAPVGIFLQAACGELTAASTPDQVCAVVRGAARQALGASNSTLLLLDGPALIPVQGDEAARNTTVWSRRPLADRHPATDAVRHRQARYAQSADELLSAYPELSAQVGDALGASAVIPLLRGSTALGVLALDFDGPRLFSGDERHFLLALARDCAAALERIRLAAELPAPSIDSLDMLDAVNSVQGGDILALAAQAGVVLETALDRVTLGYSELVEDRWVGRVFSSRVPQEVRAASRQGFDAAAPSFARPYELRQAVFVDGWDAVAEGADQTHLYGAAAFYPLFQDGEPSVLLTMGSERLEWSAHDRAVFLVVARSLELALERETSARRLNEERAALDAFVRFSETVGTESDVLILAQRAAALVHELMPHQTAGYYELEAGCWKLRAWSADLMPDLLASLQLGVPQDAPAYAEAVRTGAPLFLDGWDAEANQVPNAAVYGAAAFIPLVVQGQVRGLFSAGAREARAWTERERATVRSVARSLGLALERSELTRRLQEQNTELSARMQVLELLASISADLSIQRGENELIRQVQERVLELLPPGHAAYWELEGDLWQMRAHVNEVGNAELMAMMRAGMPVGSTPTLDIPWQTREALYQNNYAAGSDVRPDLTTHVAAVAALPVGQGTRPRGVINFTTFEPHRWSAAERALLETLARGLGLALDRAKAVEVLAARTAELEQANRQLTAANEELEAFNYSVSHDLMTPVRHVAGFSQLAEQHLADPAKARRYLGIVAQGARQMEALINGMLTLSRAGRRELNSGQVDLGRLVAQARLALAPSLAERPAEWRIGTLPHVQGDPTLLQQVMTNLLENAVKFSAERAPAVIEVWAEEDERTVTVFVRDNGAGFDPAYAGRLFGIFQRLHRQDEFAGVGVGLALVRRIVARHGGSVGAVGAVGQGATFHFTLPRLHSALKGVE